MITTQPLSVIEHLPYALDCDPHQRLLVAGLDAEQRIVETESFPLDDDRPLDDAVIAITRWPAAVTEVVAVAYSDLQSLDLLPLVQASESAARTASQVLRAGQARWRSFVCTKPRCCPRVGNRYAQDLPAHGEYHPLPERDSRRHEWRTERWDAWQEAIRSAETGGRRPGADLARLSTALFDIPLRDALLAQSARDDGFARPAMRALFDQLLHRSSLGTALPAYTCSAALAYLDGETTAARTIVNAVLAIDEYSLARLLRNGLEMRAPASLLARSFSHFDPVDLLAA